MSGRNKKQWISGILGILCLGILGYTAGHRTKSGAFAETVRQEVLQEPTETKETEEPETKKIALTFDDGPSAESTGVILDALKAHDVKATFFLVGENVERYPQIAKRIVAEGHTIGIHCYSHDYKALYESVDAYVEDFEKAKAVIYEITGVDVKLFRFPGGSINAHNKKVYQNIAKTMEDKGYLYYDWNASLEDAVKKSEPKTLLANAKESTLGRKKVVMLAHDVVYNTSLCIDELLEQFPEYQMLPLTEEVAPIQF